MSIPIFIQKIIFSSILNLKFCLQKLLCGMVFFLNYFCIHFWTILKWKMINFIYYVPFLPIVRQVLQLNNGSISKTVTAFAVHSLHFVKLCIFEVVFYRFTTVRVLRKNLKYYTTVIVNTNKMLYLFAVYYLNSTWLAETVSEQFKLLLLLCPIYFSLKIQSDPRRQ